MDAFTPEMLETLMQGGGVSAIVLVGMYRMWNGSTKRIIGIADKVEAIDKRLLRLEIKFEDSGQRRRASDFAKGE